MLLKSATGWIILANVAVYLVMVVLARGGGILSQFPGTLLIRVGMLVPTLILDDPWRLLTASFLHAGLMHLVMNMVFLGWIGGRLETAFGRGRFVLLYVASALGGSLLSWGWNSIFHHPSVGASGAIMGVLGGMVALSWRAGGRHHPLTRMWLLNSLWIFVGGVVLSLLGSIPTDNACHLGGWLVGIGLGWAFTGRPPFPAWAERLVIGAAALLVAGSFALQVTRAHLEPGLAADSHILSARRDARDALEKQDWAEADRRLAELEKADPGVVEYRVFRAEALLREGKRTEAKAELDNAVTIGTQDPELASLMVSLLKEIGGPASAPPSSPPSPSPSPTR